MAGRREKLRRVGIIPEYRGFTPDGLASGDAIDMTIDELEVLRLCDLEGLNQEAVAQQMGIARATVAAICSRAHRKVANALVNGRALSIEGGNIAYSPITTTTAAWPVKEVSTMRVATTYDNGNIFMHFGRSEQFKIYDIQDGKVLNEQVVGTGGTGHGALVGLLTNGRLFDEREHVAHAEDARGHAVGVEGLDLVELFAGADELDGLAGHRLDGERRAASGVAVELGEHDAVDVEVSSNAVAALTASWPVMASTTSRISSGLTASLTALSSSISCLVDVQAAGGIEEDHVVAVVDGVRRPPWRYRPGSSAPSRRQARRAVADDLQLLDGGGTVDVAGGEQRLFALLFEGPASLAPLVVLPAPCRPTSMTTVGGCEPKVSFCVSPPMSAVSSSLTILTTFWAGVRLSSTSAPTQRSVVFGDEVLDDLVVDVGLEQRHADLAHGFLDVGLGQVGPCRAAAHAQDRKLEFLGHGHGDTALSRSVELCHDNTVQAKRLVKLERLVQTVLACRGIDYEYDRDRHGAGGHIGGALTRHVDHLGARADGRRCR